MPVDPVRSTAFAVAYQEVSLADLREAYASIDAELIDSLVQERRVSAELAALETEASETRAVLAALGVAPVAVELPDRRTTGPRRPRSPRQVPPVIPATDDYDTILSLAAQRLGELGIDDRRDPLLQVLPTSAAARALEDHAARYGETAWERADWAVVLVAGLIGTLIDITLVGTPEASILLGRRYEGSRLTAWLKEHSGQIYERYLEPLEAVAHTPYDAPMTRDTGGAVQGMRPDLHRLMSFGHDPVLGFIVGVADIRNGRGTYVDKSGRIVEVLTGDDPVGLVEAILTELRHLLSDMATPAGLPPPLFTLLGVGQLESPFALGPSGHKVPWTDVARYMYAHGYDLRHFLAMGSTPAAVELIIRGYWLLNEQANGHAGDDAKLASMLLAGHAIATSGSMLKIGLFGINPAALNWAELLTLGPAVLRWVGAAAAHDERVRSGLDLEWQRLARESATLATWYEDRAVGVNSVDL